MTHRYVNTRMGRLTVWVIPPNRAAIVLPNLDCSSLDVTEINGEWERTDRKQPTVAQQAIINAWSRESKQPKYSDSPTNQGAGGNAVPTERNDDHRYVLFRGKHYRLSGANYHNVLRQIIDGETPDPTEFRHMALPAPINLDFIDADGAQVLLDGGTPEDAMDAQAGIPAFEPPARSKSDEKRIRMGRAGNRPPEGYDVPPVANSEPLMAADGTESTLSNVDFDEDD